MACRPPGSGSYTVVIIPLRTGLHSLDALRFYLWVKRQKDLEKEKDALCSGLEILEKARLWYLQRLQENRAMQDRVEARTGFSSYQGGEDRSCLLRSRIQRANGTLGSMMCEPNLTMGSDLSLQDAVAVSELRWRNTLLTREVSDRNRQISILESENDALVEKLDEL
uniref:suppressor APC domain-containing protein 1 isoform X2 n=1 Tax=Gasterosteus aculeatus aculeatus TaxID=481459 RepID=UPI001A9811A9|nr:suppressor APC domain-containing protein 1 isoform X2 [Gasterosteus aculeatus aculeatus]